MARTRAFHARVIPDQDGVVAERVALGTMWGTGLDQVVPLDAIVPRRQAEPARR